MASEKEIKIRLASVRNTKKITYAMKLISAAKLRKAQDAVANSRHYSRELETLRNKALAAQNGAELHHPLLVERMHVKKTRLVVVSGARGLCGGYNTNINRQVESAYRELTAAGHTVDAVCVGKKAVEYFRRTQKNIAKAYEVLPEDANLWPVAEIAEGLVQDFTNGNIDQVLLIFTHFKSAISMIVTNEKLLPISIDANQGTQSGGEREVVFEPTLGAVWDALLPRLVHAQLRKAFLDAKASEHGSRMTAMDSATKNSDDMIYSLQLAANKLRQGRITAQLLDIIGGAEAL